MPPKGNALIEPIGRLYIKPKDAPDSEFVECKFSSDGITEAIIDNESKWNGPTSFTLSFSIKQRLVYVLQGLGFLKRPKCTYKTIKRDCAKRNR